MPIRAGGTKQNGHLYTAYTAYLAVSWEVHRLPEEEVQDGVDQERLPVVEAPAIWRHVVKCATLTAAAEARNVQIRWNHE